MDVIFKDAVCRDPAQAGRSEQQGGDTMTFMLRKQHVLDRIDGRGPSLDWSEEPT